MDQNDPQRVKTFEDTSYEQLIAEGIAAVKGGNFAQANRVLQKAADYHRPDARPWLWLSAATQDPQERRSCLEKAVAADPFNAAARRGLALLSEKMDQERVLKEGEGVTPRRPAGPEEALAKDFPCPQCGGHMKFNPFQEKLVCEFCGHQQATEQKLAAESAETPIDLVLPTERGHRWAETQHRLACQRCGAVTLLPPGLKTNACPYCSSNQLIESAETLDLIDPQVIGLMKVDDQQVKQYIKKWLSKGLLTPDDLAASISRLEMRPAYYPFWTFDGILNFRWNCEVNRGSSDHPRWIPMNGEDFEIFDDVLVPGLKSINAEQCSGLEPFALKDVVAFKPEHLAGWLALSYNLSMADASLLGREKVMHNLRRGLASRVEPGHPKRNLSAGSISWSGMTFKHVLLPLWVGTYTYKNKLYTLLVNGQTGKVSGSRPRDYIKVSLLAAIGIVILAAIIGLAYMFLSK